MLSFVMLVIGFVLLVWGADKFVEGASALARKMGVSPLLVGLTIVAFGTSMPELAVSVTAALRERDRGRQRRRLEHVQSARCRRPFCRHLSARDG